MNLKKIMLFALIVLSILKIDNVQAKTLNDYYNQLADLQQKYNNNINNQKLTQDEINRLNNEIKNINTNIEKIRKEISSAEKDIETSKENIESKKDETDGLLQFLQVSNGGNIYIEYLLDAENYTDFIYRYEVIKQLTNYNSELISELEELILELENKEKELKEKNAKLEDERKQLNDKITTLSSTLNNKKSEGATIEEDIADLKKQIKIYEDKGCSRYQEISSCLTSISATGWRYPIYMGCVTSEYTGYNNRTDWSGGGTHHAIDLSCINEGTNVYPAANGVVSRIARYNCGGNAVYIRHSIKGKTYTTVYMHLLSVASGMYVGKVVTDDTVIGYVGGGSTATINGGYDYCTTGTHLHFGIAEGDSAFNFDSHSINPREKYSFPAVIFNGGGYFYR